MSGCDDLVKIVKRIQEGMPPSRNLVEELFSAQLRESEVGEYMLHLRGKPGREFGVLKVNQVDLVLSPSGTFDESSGLMFDVDNVCISLRNLRDEYGDLDLIQVARGGSDNESYGYLKRLNGQI